MKNDKKFVLEPHLSDIFGPSQDYFKDRKGTKFIEGVHFFIPENASPTKKAIFWDIQAVENWIRGNQINQELQDLLQRRQ